MLTFYQYSKEKEKQELIAQIHFKHFLLGNLVSLNKKLFSVHDCDQLGKSCNKILYGTIQAVI